MWLGLPHGLATLETWAEAALSGLLDGEAGTGEGLMVRPVAHRPLQAVLHPAWLEELRNETPNRPGGTIYYTASVLVNLGASVVA